MKIGITERGDASVHFDEWVNKLGGVDGAILITKNPFGLYKRLNEFDHSKCIIHCTITGWGGSPLEPNVPEVENSIKYYFRLRNELKPGQVVLRIDPIIPTPEGLRKAYLLNTFSEGNRVRVSFLDMYPHVRDRLKNKYPELYDSWYSIYGNSFHSLLADRKEAVNYMSRSYKVEVCGEPGFECMGCISKKDLDVLGLEVPNVGKSQQRGACACLAAKTELLNHRHPCKHGCLYCYWK